MATALVLHLQEMLGALGFHPRPAEPQRRGGDRARREVGLGGLQTPTDQVVLEPPPRGKILTNRGARVGRHSGVKVRKWGWLLSEAEGG